MKNHNRFTCRLFCCRQNMHSHEICMCAYDGKFAERFLYRAAAFKHFKSFSLFYFVLSHKSIYGKWKIFIIVWFVNRVQLTPFTYHNIESLMFEQNQFIYGVCCIMLYIHLNTEQKKKLTICFECKLTLIDVFNVHSNSCIKFCCYFNAAFQEKKKKRIAIRIQ